MITSSHIDNIKFREPQKSKDILDYGIKVWYLVSNNNLVKDENKCKCALNLKLIEFQRTWNYKLNGQIYTSV